MEVIYYSSRYDSILILFYDKHKQLSLSYTEENYWCIENSSKSYIRYLAENYELIGYI